MSSIHLSYLVGACTAKGISLRNCWSSIPTACSVWLPIAHRRDCPINCVGSFGGWLSVDKLTDCLAGRPVDSHKLNDWLACRLMLRYLNCQWQTVAEVNDSYTVTSYSSVFDGRAELYLFPYQIPSKLWIIPVLQAYELTSLVTCSRGKHKIALCFVKFMEVSRNKTLRLWLTHGV